MKLSVIILCAGRQKLLERCVSSVMSALPADAELKVIVNGDYPGNVEWLSHQPGRILWRQIPKTSRCIARNNALAESASDIVYFLDDDVEIPSHLFNLALRTFQNDPELAILGGPNLTPPSSTFLEKCFGAVVTSPFCAPKVWRRYARDKSETPAAAGQHELILCNFAVRRDLVWPRLQFLPHLTSNEENIFVFEGKRLELKICRLDGLYVYHCRRSSLLSFLRQIRSYGTGRGEQLILFPSSNHFAFYFGLLISVIALPLSIAAPALVPVVLAAYGVCGAVGAMVSQDCRRLGPLGIIAVTLLTPLVHLTYFGSIWRVLFQWAGNAVTPRVLSPVPTN